MSSKARTHIPLLQTYKIIHDRSLSYLGTEASMKSDEVKLALERHFSLKFLYQDRKVNGHVLFCMSVRGEI
jgi:hypothetical protein